MQPEMNTLFSENNCYREYWMISFAINGDNKDPRKPEPKGNNV